MDTRDGRIFTPEMLKHIAIADHEFMREMATPPTPRQAAEGVVRRNDNCPCGSGKKFKKCCMVAGYQLPVPKAS